MIWGYAAILLVYLILILVLHYGYLKQTNFLPRKEGGYTKFSIVIPFRNEAEKLPALLQSLQKLEYPKTHFEVFFVNDLSEDLSEEIITKQLEATKINFNILQNTPNQTAPKKTAITLAIAVAKYEWIITTDADCILPKGWLKAFSDYSITNQPVCIAAPVTYTANNSLLERYQQLDNWSLQSVTVGSFALQKPLLSNGANFAYRKDAFIAVNGFEGNLHIASGDDLFLLEKLTKAFPKQVGYLKSVSAVVTTYPVTSWSALVSQRVRWASKTSAQKNVATKLVGSIVFLAAMAILITPVLLLVSGEKWWLPILLLGIKMLVDGFFIASSAKFFKKRLLPSTFIVSFFINAFVTLLVVSLSIAGNYTWKKRTFKK